MTQSAATLSLKAKPALLAVRYTESGWGQVHHYAGGFHLHRRSGGVPMPTTLMTWEIQLIGFVQDILEPALSWPGQCCRACKATAAKFSYPMGRLQTATSLPTIPMETPSTQGTALASLPTTGTLVSGNMVKASGSAAIADAGIIAGPYLSKWWTFPTGTGTAGFSSSSGKATVFGVHIDYWWTFSKINYKVVVADTAGATYDLGLADRTGTIVCHIGNTVATTNFTGAGTHQLNLALSCSGPPGDYYFAITCSATSGCATLTATSGNAVTNITNTDVAVGSAGTLSNFTAPSDAWSWTATAPIIGFQ